MSQLDDVLKSGYYSSPLGCDNVDWFVNEAYNLENKMSFYFKNIKEGIIMSLENGEHNIYKNICWFCGNEILDNKVRDHCHLTGTYRGPAHEKCNINVKQKK